MSIRSLSNVFRHIHIIIASYLETIPQFEPIEDCVPIFCHMDYCGLSPHTLSHLPRPALHVPPCPRRIVRFYPPPISPPQVGVNQLSVQMFVPYGGPQAPAHQYPAAALQLYPAVSMQSVVAAAAAGGMPRAPQAGMPGEIWRALGSRGGGVVEGGGDMGRGWLLEGRGIFMFLG